MGLSYIIFHVHQSLPADGFISRLGEQLSGNLREVINFLVVVRYLASECEDDEIVIEETLR